MAETIPEGFIDVSTSQDGGVLKRILREGVFDDQPSAGEEVFVHYVGTLFGGDNDGEKFDSSRDRNAEFNFKLLQGQVIKGWDEGVATMKKGELAELICKPEYAYGASGSPPKIAPNSTLKFEVELLRWQGEDITESKDGGVTRSVVKAGEGYANPSLGSTVILQVAGRLAKDNAIFDNRDEIKFDLGDGSQHNICRGIELALPKMLKNECSRLHIASRYAFGSSGKLELNVPANADVIYEVTLKDLEALKEPYELGTNEEKIGQTEILKDKGTNYFKKNNYDLAIHFYEKAVQFLKEDDLVNDESVSVQVKNLLISTRLNLALSLLKTDSWSRCIEECDHVLELDEKNEKALFRKAQAEFARQNYDIARALFLQVADVNPENKAATQQATLCQQKVKAIFQQEKNMCRNMFGKLDKPLKPQSIDKPAGNDDSITNGDQAHDGDARMDTNSI